MTYITTLYSIAGLQIAAQIWATKYFVGEVRGGKLEEFSFVYLFFWLGTFFNVLICGSIILEAARLVDKVYAQ